MRASDIILHFQDQTKLHIKIADVRSLILNSLSQQTIEFVEDDTMDAGVLTGMLIQDEVPQAWGEPVIVNQIRFSASLDISRRRHVVCKELLHVVDPDFALTAQREDVLALIERMAVPLDLQPAGPPPYRGRPAGIFRVSAHRLQPGRNRHGPALSQ
jgi:hypothetical protein